MEYSLTGMTEDTEVFGIRVLILILMEYSLTFENSLCESNPRLS